jgi:acetyl-CoA carboxylase biotin carboxyl carrier protein
MNQKELRELIEFLKQQEIVEFEMERGDFKVKVKRAGEPSAAHVVADPRYFAVHAPPPVQESPTAAPSSASSPNEAKGQPPKEALAEEGLHIVRSPIVGTFYESPSPGSPPFVKVGDPIETGQVLCIVEAMKLMNEIEADASGELVKKLVNNGQPIEYGQDLFAIRPKK